MPTPRFLPEGQKIPPALSGDDDDDDNDDDGFHNPLIRPAISWGFYVALGGGDSPNLPQGSLFGSPIFCRNPQGSPVTPSPWTPRDP